MFNEKGNNISALQDVITKEMQKRRNKKQSGEGAFENEGLTSVHHMVAEQAIRKFKRFIKKRRDEREKLEVKIPQRGTGLNDSNASKTNRMMLMYNRSSVEVIPQQLKLCKCDSY